MRWLTDTRVRLGLGAAAVLVTALPARRDRVGHGEAQIFRAINGLPDPLYGPVWFFMQMGALGAVPAAAAAALPPSSTVPLIASPGRRMQTRLN